MSAMCLAQYPDVFRAAVSGAPVTEWEGYDTGYTERYMGLPLENPAGYRAASVLTYAPRIRGRLLLVHGLLDENVHARHTMRLIGVLTESNVTYDLLLLPEERHVPRSKKTKDFVEARIREFFHRTLKLRL